MEHNGYDRDKIVITYIFNQIQRDAIKNLFGKEKWDYRELNAQKNSNDDFDPDDYEPGYIIKQSDTDNECPFSVCQPCITNQHHAWRPQALKPPNILNSKSRKICYKSSCTMLFHRRVWKDAKYVTQTLAALGMA